MANLLTRRKEGVKKIKQTFHPFVPFVPQHQYTQSLYCSLYIFCCVEKENLLNNQERLLLVGDYFLYSRDLQVDIVRRNQMLIILGVKRAIDKSNCVCNAMFLWKLQNPKQLQNHLIFACMPNSWMCWKNEGVIIILAPQLPDFVIKKPGL